MNDPVIAAWIAGLFSALATAVSLVVAIWTSSSNRRLKLLEEEIARRQSERNARRDYDYEAKKRLYLEFEPLRFQLLEAVSAARDFIVEVSERARTSDAADPGDRAGGAYMRAARIYYLICPAVCGRAIQRKLTLVDLGLDESVYIQYLLAKEVSVLLTLDAAISRHCGMDYTPYVAGWRQLRTVDPGRYRRQGFTPGRLDNYFNLILENDEAHGGMLSFGGFESLLAQRAPDDVNSAIGAAADLFEDFEPAQRPVLWRLLMAQYAIYGILIDALRGGDCGAGAPTVERLQSDLSGIEVTPGEASQVASFVRSRIGRHFQLSRRRESHAWGS